MIPVLFLLAALVALIALVVGLISPRLVLRGELRTRSKAALVYSMAFLVSIIGLVTTIPPAEKREAQPEAIAPKAIEKAEPAVPTVAEKLTIEQLFKKASSRFVYVATHPAGNGKNNIAITYKADQIWTAKSYVSALSFDLWSAVRAATDAYGEEVASYVIVAEGPTKDQYGNVSTQEWFRLTVPGSEMQKVNWKSMDINVLFGLSQVTPANALGRSVITEWCLGQDDRRLSAGFCRRQTG